MQPIVEMYWVAEYNNGRALPQFDPFSGKENQFSQVDHKNVLRFWWLPITLKMSMRFPNTRYNPRLRQHGVGLNGSKGFVTRRTQVTLGSGNEPPKPVVKCYILGIEGGPRQEIYPDGSVISKKWPDGVGESQDLLHHG